MRVAGFSATPFRLDTGRLDEGEGKIFDDVVFDYGLGQGIRDGWLSPLTSKAAKVEINVNNVDRRGGEFIAGELERAADDDATVSAACDEIMARGGDRRSWLVFCCGVAHAHHVGQALRARGVSCRVVTGETPSAERADSIAMFKAGIIRCLVNVNVLTTGFDAPRIDLLAMLRPTLSTGLYVQMVGRGTRKAEGKTNCLILDFAGNVRRHGPVDSVDIKLGDSNRAAVAPATAARQDLPRLRRDQPARRRGLLGGSGHSGFVGYQHQSLFVAQHLSQSPRSRVSWRLSRREQARRDKKSLHGFRQSGQSPPARALGTGKSTR